jgi:hypothetical protein
LPSCRHRDWITVADRAQSPTARDEFADELTVRDRRPSVEVGRAEQKRERRLIISQTFGVAIDS